MRTIRSTRPRRGFPLVPTAFAAIMSSVAIVHVGCTTHLPPSKKPNSRHAEKGDEPVPSAASAATVSATNDTPAPVAPPRDAGQPFDMQGFVDSALAAGKQRIVIPPGRWRVTPRDRQHLVIWGRSDIEIVADGVELICTETTRALTIGKCRNVTLRGLTIDYDPLPFTQGRIVSMSDDKLVHEIELFDGYASSAGATVGKYEIFDRDTRTLRFGSYYGCTLEKIAPRRVRVTKPDNYRNSSPEQVGDIIATGNEYAPGGSIPHAIYCPENVNVTLEDVSLYGSNCFGFFETDCTASTYRRCRIDRRPLKTDLKDRADARIRSLNADAYHSKFAAIGPRYIECTARFMGDDCVAINGDYHMVMSVLGRTIRVLGKDNGMNVAPGDPLEMVAYDGPRLADAKVVSVERDDDTRDDERAFLLKQHMHEPFKTGLRKAWRITVDRAVELPRGSLVCSANRIGNGYKVIGCTMGFNRSRGILLKAGDGEVRANTLEGCWMEAIKLTPEFWWLEGGCGNNVVIEDNVVKDCGKGIEVRAHSGKAPAGAHRNVTIRNNTVTGVPSPCIYVESTRQLVIAGNKLEPSKNSDAGKQAVELVRCAEVQRDDR